MYVQRYLFVKWTPNFQPNTRAWTYTMPILKYNLMLAARVGLVSHIHPGSPHAPSVCKVHSNIFHIHSHPNAHVIHARSRAHFAHKTPNARARARYFIDLWVCPLCSRVLRCGSSPYANRFQYTTHTRVREIRYVTHQRTMDYIAFKSWSGVWCELYVCLGCVWQHTLYACN